MKETIDETLRPIEANCAECGGAMTIYPDNDKGVGVCPNCSPNWLDSFARFRMNALRKQYGLSEL